MQPRRGVEVAEPVLAEVLHGHAVGPPVADELLGGRRDHDLIAVARVGDARGLVHRERDVVAAARSRLTAVEAHADAQPFVLLVRGERRLGVDRGATRGAGVAERSEQPVAGRLDDRAAVARDRVADGAECVREERRIGGAEPLQRARRAGHVAEEERHQPARQDDVSRGGGRCRRGRHARPVQRRRLVQDRLLQGAQLGTGLDAQLLAQVPAHLLVGPEGFGLAAGAVQRGHPQGPQPLPQRRRRAPLLELGQQGTVVTEVQLGVEALFDDHPPQLVEPGGLATEERLGGQLAQAVAPPLRLGSMEVDHRAGVVARISGRSRQAELVLGGETVELAGRGAEEVALGVALDGGAAGQLGPQSREVDGKRAGRGARRPRRPTRRPRWRRPARWCWAPSPERPARRAPWGRPRGRRPRG